MLTDKCINGKLKKVRMPFTRIQSMTSVFISRTDAQPRIDLNEAH